MDVSSINHQKLIGDGRKFHYPSKNEWMMDMSFINRQKSNGWWIWVPLLIKKVMGDKYELH